jgi:hypothetical protein
MLKDLFAKYFKSYEFDTKIQDIQDNKTVKSYADKLEKAIDTHIEDKHRISINDLMGDMQLATAIKGYCVGFYDAIDFIREVSPEAYPAIKEVLKQKINEKPPRL